MTLTAGRFGAFLVVTKRELSLAPVMLIWSPVRTAMEKWLAGGAEFKLIIVPFIKLEALSQLLGTQPNLRGLKVVVRWRANDLLSGASDLAIYDYLKSRGCALFLHPRIHLKLYVFGNNAAICTSANLTMTGLGYLENANIEAGCGAELSSDDWRGIYELIAESRPVNDEVFECYRKFIGDAPKAPTVDSPDLILPARKVFSIASLPATKSPGEFINYYMKRTAVSVDPEFARRAAHDEALFLVPPGLSESELLSWLRQRFCAIPFVIKFVEHLRHSGSLRFGAANEWIHSNCDDSPLPYRWEIKENTNILYNWLAEFFSPNVAWSIPGKHSQVIVWKANE